MMFVKPHPYVAAIFLLVLVYGKPQHSSNQQDFERGIKKYNELQSDDTAMVGREIRQAPVTPTPASSNVTSTRIPPANPEITTVYKVPCSCPFTPQYDPVCGSDGQNYGNAQILTCAQFCGSNVTLVYRNACGSNRG